MMERLDALVIGGGPAGSTCAGRLRAGGLEVLVVDQAQFPRPKLCAGWITPAVLQELELDVNDYRQGRVFQPVTSFNVGQIDGPSMTVAWDRPVSYAIRRIEFDDYLLRRCGARFQGGEPVHSIRRSGKSWIVNERFEARVLVGAGGHFCPVARLLGLANSVHGPLIASQEIEFPLTPAQAADCTIDPETPEFYFCKDLLGYGWCIRKGDYLNVGLGRASRRQLPGHVSEFCKYLGREGRIANPLPGKFQGHMYLLYGQSARPLVDDAVVWIGDAAGMAYWESGEGIRPAIQSALMAAETILDARGDYCRARLDPYRRRVESRFGRRRTQPPTDRSPSALRCHIAGWLLRRRWFVRHVVLNRWFLHG